MKLGTKPILADDGKTEVAFIQPASERAVQYTLNADEDSDDGRSEWLWVRLPNGDLFLGVYPQGETYEAFEEEHS